MVLGANTPVLVGSFEFYLILESWASVILVNLVHYILVERRGNFLSIFVIFSVVSLVF